MKQKELARFLRGLMFEAYMTEKLKRKAWYCVELNLSGVIYRWYKVR